MKSARNDVCCKRCSDSIKFSKTKATLQPDIDWREEEPVVEFWKKKCGGLKIHVQGRAEIPSKKKETCDMGHEHWVTEKKKWVWMPLEIDRGALKKLAEWLQRDPSLWEPEIK